MLLSHETLEITLRQKHEMRQRHEELVARLVSEYLKTDQKLMPDALIKAEKRYKAALLCELYGGTCEISEE